MLVSALLYHLIFSKRMPRLCQAARSVKSPQLLSSHRNLYVRVLFHISRSNPLLKILDSILHGDIDNKPNVKDALRPYSVQFFQIFQIYFCTINLFVCLPSDT